MGRRGIGIVVLALASVVASPARGDFSEPFAFSGTVQPFGDLDTYVIPGSTTVNSFHVLPDLAVGAAVTGSGSITYNAAGIITSGSLQVSMPAGLGFTYQLTDFNLRSGYAFAEFDSADPRAGFTLITSSIDCDHLAVQPANALYDDIGSVYFHAYSTDASMDIKVIHPSLFAGTTIDVPINLTRFHFGTVPEPASLALLAIGSLALVGGRRGRRSRWRAHHPPSSSARAARARA